MITSCAAGCGTQEQSGPQTACLAETPPNGWITLSMDVAFGTRPYQGRDGRFSAVCCSLDCAMAFVRRQAQLISFSITPKPFAFLNNIVAETRSDIAKRIGFAVLDAIDDLDETDANNTVLLPLDAEQNRLRQNIALALLPFDTEESASESSEFKPAILNNLGRSK
jgi:hypothetical protein